MYKFFVNKSQLESEKVNVLGDDINHIKNVLRLKIDETVLICVKEMEQSFECKLTKIDEDLVQASIIGKIEEKTEPNIEIHLFQGLPKFEKMELIIEKTTELGVHEITPIEMKRCVVKLDEKSKIAEVAAKQSKRDIIPTINNIINIKNIFPILQKYDIVLVAYENEKNNTLKCELKKIKKDKNSKIAVIIGPEGGIDESEISLLNSNNTKVVTLGKRILRTETAPISMISNIVYEFED